MKPAWQSGAGFGVLMAVGALALNYPLLSLFDRDASVLGIPLLFLHVFVVWILLIAGLAVLADYRGSQSSRTDAAKDPTDRPGNGVSFKSNGNGLSAVGKDSISHNQTPDSLQRKDAGD